MKFDGSVGDLGSSQSITTYEMSYLGSDLKKLKEFVLKRCKEKGLEVVEVMEGKEKDGRWKVTARVKSGVGIV